jgi:ATP-dependent protease ClpP protease subunit
MRNSIDDDAISTTEKDKIVIKNPINHEYIISIDSDISEPENYREVFEVLRTAKDGDIAYLNINSYGGYIHSMVEFYDVLLNTKARTIANVYTAYSAGSVIALSCDEIRIKKFGSLMIHCMSSGTSGKIIDMQGYSDFAIKQDRDIANTIYSGFLTKDEIAKINHGKEIWINQEDAMARLKTFKTIKQRFLK